MPNSPGIRTSPIRSLAIPSLALQFPAVLARVRTESTPTFALALVRSTLDTMPDTLVYWSMQRSVVTTVYQSKGSLEGLRRGRRRIVPIRRVAVWKIRMLLSKRMTVLWRRRTQRRRRTVGIVWSCFGNGVTWTCTVVSVPSFVEFFDRRLL